MVDNLARNYARVVEDRNYLRLISYSRGRGGGVGGGEGKKESLRNPFKGLYVLGLIIVLAGQSNKSEAKCLVGSASQTT